jgi:hypothetical protein
VKSSARTAKRLSYFEGRECRFESYEIKCKDCRASLGGVIDPYDDALLLSVVAQDGRSD